MVLGLALCASFAYAQTCNFNKSVENAKLSTDAPIVSMDRPTDYKASIFTKDTVLYRCEFSAGEWNNQVTVGNIQSGDVIDGAAATPHGQTGALQQWHRVPDSASFVSSTGNWGAVDYKSYIINRVRPYYAGNDNGFAFMYLNQENGTGVHNSYMQFPTVDRPADVAIIDVRFLQGYINYYDECFIDYKIGNAWHSRAINVDGVDVGINSVAARNANYTMPVQLAQESTITIRVRYFADGQSGNAYGYLWGLDNLCIVGGTADRWFTNEQMFLDGFYGTMPQGMSIPITWYGEVVNNGSNVRSDVSYTLEHLDADLIGTPIVNANYSTSLAADPTTINYMVVDERGFFAGEQANRPASGVFAAGNIGGSHLGMWMYAPNYASNNITGQYGLQGLPVAELGQQFFAASASSTGAEDIVWDTVAYQVVGMTGGDGTLELPGYRWSKDNGIIPSNSLYKYGYDADGQYISSDCPRWNSAGYTLMNRFTTGNTVPTDWVFRGVEIVPQTVDALSDIVGSKIYPVMYECVWVPDSNDWEFEDVETGFSSTIPHSVTMAELNDLATGRIAPSQTYKAVNLQFFEQPILKPNTSYYIGFQLATDGKFGAATQQYSYLDADGQTSIPYYADATPEVANGYNQFNASSYDMFMLDPGKGWYFITYNHDMTPLIRPIVGPRMTIPEFHINATCGTGVEIINEDDESICGSYVSAYQGSNPTVYIVPEGNWCDTCNGAYKIETISVDGQVIDIDEEYDDFTVSEGVYNVYNADSSQTMLLRSYFAITFNSLDSNRAVSATAAYHIWQPVGIDPAALNVSLGLQPNPATSSVKLNISGVTGMVNCSIIDMSGRVIYNADINAEQQQVIDLSNVAAGAYFVRVTNDKFSKVEKLIVR